MRKFDRTFLKIGRYTLGVIFIWIGLLGLLEGAGFTTVTAIPFLEFSSEQLEMIIYAAQVIVGAALFLPKLTQFAKILVVIHVILIVFTFIQTVEIRFDPGFPYLAQSGILSLLELGLTTGIYAYLKGGRI